MGTRRWAFFSSPVVAVALLGSAGWAPAADPVTIPSSVQAGEGNSDNQFPLNGDPIRYQQVIAASEFPAGQRWITRIALRPDGASGAAFSETLSNVQINLSTTQKAPGALSKTFADNIGSDEKVVASGALALSSSSSGPDGGPKAFDIVITLDAPFLYDPAAGNLLLDVRNYSGGKTTQLDAHDAPDSTSRIWSGDVRSATGTQGDPFPSVGLVIRFLSN
jgi:hypothetical protein